MNRIPGTIIEYTRTVSHQGQTIYRTRHGWQMKMGEGLETKPSLNTAKQLISDVRRDRMEASA